MTFLLRLSVTCWTIFCCESLKYIGGFTVRGSQCNSKRLTLITNIGALQFNDQIIFCNLQCPKLVCRPEGSVHWIQIAVPKNVTYVFHYMLQSIKTHWLKLGSLQVPSKNRRQKCYRCWWQRAWDQPNFTVLCYNPFLLWMFKHLFLGICTHLVIFSIRIICKCIVSNKKEMSSTGKW